MTGPNVLLDAAMSDDRWHNLVATVDTAELRRILGLLEGQRRHVTDRIDYVRMLIGLDARTL